MTRSSPSGPALAAEHLQRLTQEQERLRTCLQRLGAYRAEAPRDVWTRVEADYVKRLDGLVAEAERCVAELREALATAELETRSVAQRAAELKLRHRVGELDANELALRSAAYEQAREAAAREAEQLRQELPRVEAVLEQLRQTNGTPAGNTTLPSPAPRRSSARPTTEMFPEWDSPAAAPLAAATEDYEEEDGLDFLQHLPASGAAAPAAPPTAGPAAAVKESAPRAPAPRTSPAVADAPTEQILLLCGGCGHGNDPRAWYCDGCGAELS